MSRDIWAELDAQAKAAPQIAALFASDPCRFDKFSARFDDMLLDFSKTSLTDKSLALLLRLAAEAGVEARRDAMFAGEKINVTENRAVLHTALRAPRGASVLLDGQDVIPAVHAMLDRLFAFAEAVRGGTLTGADRPAFHGRGQYRHRRVGPRSRHGHRRPGPVS